MGLEAEVDLLADDFKTAWETGNPIDPVPFVWWENRTLPDSVSPPYIRFSLGEGDEKRVAGVGQSQGLYVSPGVIFIQIFTKRHSGTTDASKMVDHIRNHYRGLRLNGPPIIEFMSSRVVSKDTTSAGNGHDYSKLLTINFSRLEQH